MLSALRCLSVCAIRLKNLFSSLPTHSLYTTHLSLGRLHVIAEQPLKRWELVCVICNLCHSNRGKWPVFKVFHRGLARHFLSPEMPSRVVLKSQFPSPAGKEAQKAAKATDASPRILSASGHMASAKALRCSGWKFNVGDLPGVGKSAHWVAGNYCQSALRARGCECKLARLRDEALQMSPTRDGDHHKFRRFCTTETWLLTHEH